MQKLKDCFLVSKQRQKFSILNYYLSIVQVEDAILIRTPQIIGLSSVERQEKHTDYLIISNFSFKSMHTSTSCNYKNLSTNDNEKRIYLKSRYTSDNLMWNGIIMNVRTSPIFFSRILHTIEQRIPFVKTRALLIVTQPIIAEKSIHFLCFKVTKCDFFLYSQ